MSPIGLAVEETAARQIPERDQRETSALLRNIHVCYFLSGALGLVYQVLWLRKLLLVFGSTVHAISTVLTVFFAGLALGSYFFGRLIDRREASGLRWYAMLELGVGAYAFVTPFLFDAIKNFYIPVYRASGFSPIALVSASFICSALILFLPTTLLGGTFPVLSRFLIRTSEERGSKVASLYGINTAGAMVGTLFVYYSGLPVLGLTNTLWFAGVLNIGIGLLCMIFDRHLESMGFHVRKIKQDDASSRAAEPQPKLVGWLMFSFALSGFSAMVYEVAWTRALSLVLGSSIYAFCIMLATFLGGIAIGSFIARRSLSLQKATLNQFIIAELALGAYALVSIPLFSQLPQWFVTLWPLSGHSFLMLSLLQALISVLAMILPTIIMGFLFPLVSSLSTGGIASLGRRLGSIYALNTLGGIAGSFLSGFVLIPILGLPWAIVCAGLVNIIAALLIYAVFGRRFVLSLRAALAALMLLATCGLSRFVILPAWKRHVFAAGVYLFPDRYRGVSVNQGAAGTKLLYYKDSLNATVSVHQQGKSIFLKVGGKTDASNGMDMSTQVLSAHIPLLLHKNPKSVLVIGLGSGITLGHAGRYPISTLHCAELDQAVIEGSRFFKDYNYAVHDDPRVKMFAVDGRNFLLASPAQYDVIISEPSNPWMAGLGYLFTQEFYQLAKRRLAADGIMCQWLQLYGIFPNDLKLLLKTFHEEFPHVSVWSSIPGDILLVGSMMPHRIDYERLLERMSSAKIKESLNVVQIDSPETLMRLFLFGARELEQFTADTSWLHQDNLPWIEFSAPKSLYTSTDVINYKGMQAFLQKPDEIVRGYDIKREDARFYQALCEMWAARNEYASAVDALERSLELDSTSAKAWRRLGQLRLELRQYLKAQDALLKAIKLAPADIEAYRLLAKLYWQQRKLDDARNIYNRLASIQAPDMNLAREIGNYFKDAKDFLWASEYYRSSLSQGGSASESLLQEYAKTLNELKSYDEELRVLKFSVMQFPKQVIFPLMLGDILLERGRLNEAEDQFKHALRLAPKNAQVYYGLGRIAFKQGHTEEAKRYLSVGLLYNPYHKEALTLLSRLQGKHSI